MDQKIFSEIKRLPFKRTIEDVDIREFDKGHVIPNMNLPVYRGTWFPPGDD